MKRWILFSSSILLITIVVATWYYSRQPRPIVLIPTLTEKPEYCLTCHADLPEISPSHPVQTFGCVICHGGERLALEANLAHSTMRGGANPSDLSVVEQSCGGSACHSGEAKDNRDHIQRVMTSIQATYAGAIANIRYTFGAQPDQKARLGIFAIADPAPTREQVGEKGVSPEALGIFDPSRETSPSLLAFAQNCLHCHLSAEPQPRNEYDRMTGCAACHTPTANTSDSQPVHQLTTAIPYTQCNTCHNRGNYDLRDMQFHARQDQPTDRLHDYYQPIAQFTRCEYELDCVDCHTREEAMGDGHLYNNQKEIQYVQCRTCHGTKTELPLTRTITDPDDIALRLAFLNPVVNLQVGDNIVVTDQGEPIWNLRKMPDGKYEMVAKVTGTRYTVPMVMGSTCQQKPDEQESRYCHACHAVEH